MRLQNNPRNPMSIPCPRCKQLISANSASCIHCGLRQPSFYYNFPVLDSLLRERVQFTNGIIAICFAMFIASIAMTIAANIASGAQSPLGGDGGLLGMLNFAPSHDVLLRLATSGTISWGAGKWWGLLTATYLHADVLHILFNMLALRSLGPLVEYEFGGSRFIIIYTLTGLAGSLVTLFVGIPSSVGASGAVFGLIGALLYYGWRRGGVWGRNIFRNMLFWSLINIGLGFINPYINNYAHIAGAVSGFLLAVVLSFNERQKATLTHHILALLTLALVAACFISMFANVIAAAI